MVRDSSHIPDTISERTSLFSALVNASTAFLISWSLIIHLPWFASLALHFHRIRPEAVDIAVGEGIGRLEILDLVDLEPDIGIRVNRSPGRTPQADDLIGILLLPRKAQS